MNRPYVYRTQKDIDGRVRRYYVGRVGSAAAEQHERQVDRRRRLRQTLRDVERYLSLLDELTDDLRELENAAMAERGYEQNNYRKWKRYRPD
jgi:hypothetical protein